MAPEDWKEFVDLLIEDMSKGSRGSFYHEISSLLIAEERWDELLRRLEQEPYLSYIERSEQYLKDKHPERLATLYVSAIKMKLEQNVGRNHYKEACRYIRRIKKLDQHDIADKLVAELKVLYPQRRALMEELSLV